MEKGFAYANNTFINLYNQENPILEEGDECYFCFFGYVDVHLPYIGKGIIRKDKFVDGLNKLYYIQLTDILETNDVAQSKIYGRKFILYPLDNDDKIQTPKQYVITTKNELTLLNNRLFQTEGFFVRTTVEAVKKLQIEYGKIIKQELLTQISEIDNIIISKEY